MPGLTVYSTFWFSSSGWAGWLVSRCQKYGAHAGVAPAVLMLTGGVLYTAGALSYHHRRPNPRPSVFGYHEVFHAFVCAAATCQFVAVAAFIT
jgi:channel protein (hemolysin III family)